MALDYETLDYKPEVEQDDLQMKDLLVKSFNEDVDWSSNCQYIKVTKEYVGRPDLVSYVLYKDDKYADIICKLNGISNPFELNEGMVLLCPDINYIGRFTGVNVTNIDGFAEDSIELHEKHNTYKKRKNEKRSPNEATVYDHNFIEIPNTDFIIY